MGISFLAFAIAPFTRHVLRRVNLDRLNTGSVLLRDITALLDGGVEASPPVRVLVVPVGCEVVVRPVGATSGFCVSESDA